jgi:hypothetical protein
MALTHDIEMGRSKYLTMTALFLDMQGAFDNVSSTQLTSTMRQLGCPMPVVSWCRSFLMERTMALSFNGRIDTQWPIAIGIPQGSPASPILFLRYLRPLFDSLQLQHPSIWEPELHQRHSIGCPRQEKRRELESAGSSGKNCCPMGIGQCSSIR